MLRAEPSSEAQRRITVAVTSEPGVCNCYCCLHEYSSEAVQISDRACSTTTHIMILVKRPHRPCLPCIAGYSTKRWRQQLAEGKRELAMRAASERNHGRPHRQCIRPLSMSNTSQEPTQGHVLEAHPHASWGKVPRTVGGENTHLKRTEPAGI